MIESLVIWKVPFLGKVKIGLAKTESSSIRTTDCRAVEIAIKATGMDSSTGKHVSTVNSKSNGYILKKIQSF
jgi:hypothetical protein